MCGLRKDAKWKKYYDIAFGKRPREELFVLKDDPDQMRNVAADPKYAEAKAMLNKQLMGELRKTGDPRVGGGECIFDKPPFVGELLKR